MHIKAFLLFALLGTGMISHAQSWQDTAALINTIFSRYEDKNPGAQLAISRNGQLIYSIARGMADLEHNVPLDKTSRIEAGSVSKQFTAAAILLLEQQGKLSLDDDVRKYVPEVPDYGYRITIRHLMNHTSGLKDWGAIAKLSGWPRGTKAYTNNDALRIISQQKTLNYKPGDEYLYSNSGYTLLTHIVQRVSRMSHADFTRKYIFEPAGMNNTEWRDNYRRVVPGRAIAYSRVRNGYITNMPNEDTYGHGGLLTTAEDLVKWSNFYLAGKLGTGSLLQRQTSITPLNNGRKNTYAAGLVIDTLNGLLLITHSGATAGYRANLETFPKLGLTIALLSNTSQSFDSPTATAVRQVFVKTAEQTGIKNAEPATVRPANFALFAGAYRENMTGTGLRIYLTDSIVMSDPNGRLTLLSGNKAMVGRAKLEFAAKSRTVSMITASGDTLQYSGVEPPDISEISIHQLTGTYFSTETDSKLDVVTKAGNLFIQIRDEEWPLIPVYKDGFSFPEGDVFFTRDKSGKVTNLYISISRARKVEFSKVQSQRK